MYSGEVLEQSFEWVFDIIDKLALNKTQKEKIEEIFVFSVEFEYMFWIWHIKKSGFAPFKKDIF